MYSHELFRCSIGTARNVTLSKETRTNDIFCQGTDDRSITYRYMTTQMILVGDLMRKAKCACRTPEWMTVPLLIAIHPYWISFKSHRMILETTRPDYDLDSQYLWKVSRIYKVLLLVIDGPADWHRLQWNDGCRCWGQWICWVDFHQRRSTQWL